ncbi:MAG: DUF6580 family putative transport protein [Pseudomonadota bacterium]
MQYFYVIAAILLRLLPHPWNITPLGAMFLFSGATFDRKKDSLVVPLAALIISDIAVVEFLYQGHYAWFSPFTWLGFISAGLVGWSLRSKFSGGRLLVASFAGSLLFFLISNFGVWVEGVLYPHTLQGLVECYATGIPFFRNSLLGDFFYVVVMFGSYRWLKAKRPSLGQLFQRTA